VPVQLEPAQRELLAALRGRRDQATVDAALAVLSETAAGTGDLMPPIVAAVAVDATLGEVCGALRDVFGSFRPGGAAAI
jgi:methylmalonyl-CoA mutase N-terminal domain/subunit